MVKKRMAGRKGKSKRWIFYLAVILGIIIVLSVLTPFITGWITDASNSGKYDGFPGLDPGTPHNDTERGEIPEADPNYKLNITEDRAYKIQSGSWVDYKGISDAGFSIFNPPKTAYGQDYVNFDGNIKIIVTDLNNTPISGAEFILTAWATDTAPWGISYFIQDRITLFDGETITAQEGTNANEFNLGNTWGGLPEDLGWYNDRHMDIQLTDEMLLTYSDFIVTTEIIFNYNANIYVRLGSDTQRLLEIQQEILNDGAYQDYRTADTVTSGGLWDDDWQGAMTHDLFYGLDTTNLTGDAGEYFTPEISEHDNDVFKFRTKTMFATADLTDVTDIGFYYVLYNGDLEIINPETYALNFVILDLNNESVGYSLESNSYYIFVLSGVLDEPYNEFGSLPLIYYNGATEIETVGRIMSSWENEDFITEFSYTYSNYYVPDGDVHRIIYDENDKMPLICDFNSPLYLNGSDTFKFRYFLATDGQPLNSVGETDATFHFYLEVTISDENHTYLTIGDECLIAYNQIGTTILEADLGTIEPQTSYLLTVTITSMEDTNLYGADRYSAVYSECLYYLLTEYYEFQDEINDLMDLYESLETREDVGSGTYSTLKEIMGMMKTKIGDLEDSLDSLEGSNGGRGAEFAEKCRDSINEFKNYVVYLSVFMDSNTPEQVAASGPLFCEFKGLMWEFGFWYSDSFTQYNAYVCALKGETGIADDIDDITDGTRGAFKDRADARRNGEYMKFLPFLVVALAAVVSLILTLIVYLMFRDRIRNRWALFLLCLIVFIVLFLVIYTLMLGISETILFWYYGV